MANDADSGFMIWDGKSKGTLMNIIDLLNLNKPVEIYHTEDKAVQIINPNRLTEKAKNI